MAELKSTQQVRIADGGVIELTRGEIKALHRYVAMNGESTESVQYDPGHVRHDTKWNMVRKGIFVLDPNGTIRLARGVLSK